MDLNSSQFTQFSTSQAPTIYPVSGQMIPFINSSYQNQFIPYGASIIHHPFTTLQQPTNWQHIPTSSNYAQLQAPGTSQQDFPVQTLSDLKQQMCQSMENPCTEFEKQHEEVSQHQKTLKINNTQRKVADDISTAILPNLNKNQKNNVIVIDKVIKPHMKVGCPLINSQGFKVIKVVDEFKGLEYFKCAYCASNRIFFREQLLEKHIKNCSDYLLINDKKLSNSKKSKDYSEKIVENYCEASTQASLHATEASKKSLLKPNNNEKFNFELENVAHETIFSDEAKNIVSLDGAANNSGLSQRSMYASKPQFLTTEITIARQNQKIEKTNIQSKEQKKYSAPNFEEKLFFESPLNEFKENDIDKYSDEDAIVILQQLTDSELKELLKDQHPILYQYLAKMNFVAVDKKLLLELILGLISKSLIKEKPKNLSLHFEKNITSKSSSSKYKKNKAKTNSFYDNSDFIASISSCSNSSCSKNEISITNLSGSLSYNKAPISELTAKFNYNENIYKRYKPEKNDEFYKEFDIPEEIKRKFSSRKDSDLDKYMLLSSSDTSSRQVNFSKINKLDLLSCFVAKCHDEY